ncbi:MAG TPA: dihydrolipoyl dehydrogenase [Mogibacterium sp.]|nr:dihydrolipoyl dehydrogenase [Mogibacterium sp.]
MNEYDLIIIGAGPGGYVGAIRAAQLGLSVCVIERREVGGTCLNRGCIPTKSLLYTSELYAKAQRDFELLGLHIDNITYDSAKMYARKDQVVKRLRGGVEQLLKSHGVKLLFGTGSVSGPGKVKFTSPEKEETMLSAKNILIASGSKPFLTQFPGCDLPGVITSDELLSQSDIVKKKLIVFGAGVIAVEFATVFANLGCEVSLIVRSRLMRIWDTDISKNFGAVLKKRGVKVYGLSTIKEVVKDGSGLLCRFTSADKDYELEADSILVATGRQTDTDGLFCDGFTLPMEKGCIVVNDRFETSVPGIYAIGDVIGGMQLAHLASAQAITVCERLAGKEPSVCLDFVPNCVYTDPEIAAVGITEAKAEEEGRKVVIGKYSMMGNGKTIIENGERGFIKLIFDAETDIILGAQLMCQRATDIIAELANACVNRMTSKQLINVMRPHPTFCEAVTEAVEAAHGMSIHSAPPRR